MHNETPSYSPVIRRLRASDQPELAAHFHRLDQNTRRLRFGGMVSDAFVADYAAKILSDDSVIFGAFSDDTLRGVAELRGAMWRWPRSAEVALLVEPAWQDKGLGDALLGRLIAAAQNRGIKTLQMMCLRENRRMQALARKHKATLEITVDSVEATLAPAWPTPMSLFEEIFGNPRSYLPMGFHLPT
ncbi:GNAT family N-acetyltransferase [Pseudoruegeria sp. SK021]|uniref:GNAT family N-acetyltransferase n=1 Tax=Pseudoruegeria sp. SK021 TaxID=1933035 RepID=UPI000A24A0F5|nr:GNAT family N-acetyltransferase [Pseudoruegeria sp. SK021]OSP54863.1 hypothetical protein BV911_10335 [Pseudoruegeria sp. SK021]